MVLIERISVLIIALTISISAQASIETDKAVGSCAGLLSVLQKKDRALEAFSYADNQQRALKFAKAWIAKADEYAIKNDRTMVNSMIYKATGNCHDIGISTTD